MKEKSTIKSIKYGLIFILLLSVFCTFLQITAFAENSENKASLTLQYIYENAPVKNTLFKIYKIAETDDSGKITPSEDFEKYPVDFEISDSESMRKLAATLYGYINRDGIAETDSNITDSGGTVVFPNKNVSLSPGVYLVAGTVTKDGDYIYRTEPFIVKIPQEKDGGYEFNVTAFPKCYREQNDGQTVTRKVIKVWKDNGSETRPKEITVLLLKDGEVYDTVKLNSENGWSYTWQNLEKGHDWTVAEKETEGYTVNVSREKITFVITNTKDSDIPKEPDKPKDPTLPNTGQTLWPVPLLIAAGLLLIVLGFVLRRGAAIKNSRGAVLIIAGSILLAAAVLLTGVNLYEESNAEKSAEKAVNTLSEYISSVKSTNGEDEEIPEYILNPEKEMPVKTIDGINYIGTVEIPALGIYLPVAETWSYPLLKISPCRYMGSAYTENLIIIAHNYPSHFGNLQSLNAGDEVIFTDMDGNVFEYEVTLTETLLPTDVEEMESGDWDLTLFSCNPGVSIGTHRITVRCTRKSGGV